MPINSNEPDPSRQAALYFVQAPSACLLRSQWREPSGTKTAVAALPVLPLCLAAPAGQSLIAPRAPTTQRRPAGPYVGAGVATGPVKFVVEALKRLDWTWGQVEDWTACTYRLTYVCICGGNLDGAAGCWS
jgi:hypothetical protein